MRNINISLMLLLSIGLTSCEKNEVVEEPELKDGCKIVTAKYSGSETPYGVVNYYLMYEGNIKIPVTKQEYDQYSKGDTYCRSDLKGK